MSEFVEPAYLSLFSCGYGVWIRVNPCGILPIPAFPKSGKEQQYFIIRSIMRFWVAFGLFGMSENSSFPSTLRAWFAFAHSSPPTGMTENQLFPIPALPKSGKEQRYFRNSNSCSAVQSKPCRSADKQGSNLFGVVIFLIIRQLIYPHVLYL